MRALSNRTAARCETAMSKTCRCRCGGVLHGAMRHLIEEGRGDPQFFEQLAESDPHHVRSKEEQKWRRKQARLGLKAKADDPQLTLWQEKT